jgi:D-aminoacyl-tRNA deacylase
MKLIVVSEKDPAGNNMYDLLVKEFGFKEEGTFEEHKKYKKENFTLIKCKKDVLYLEYLNEFFQPELWIIGSRHKSSVERKTLSCHTPGNFCKAEAGGKEKQICYSPALYLRKALQTLEKEKPNGYETTLEVTHHGPSQMNAPCMFVEVGGSEKEWQDIEACRVVCKSIMSLDKIDEKEKSKDSEQSAIETFAGFGGPHYAPRFTKLTLEGKAIGHIIPQYNIDEASEEMIIESINKTIPKPETAIIEWKGLNSAQRQKLIQIFEKNKIKWIKT